MDYKKLTRREALKYLGTTVAGMTLASTSALSIFTSCTEKGKNASYSISLLRVTAFMRLRNFRKLR